MSASLKIPKKNFAQKTFEINRQMSWKFIPSWSHVLAACPVTGDLNKRDFEPEAVNPFSCPHQETSATDANLWVNVFVWSLPTHLVSEKQPGTRCSNKLLTDNRIYRAKMKRNDTPADPGTVLHVPLIDWIQCPYADRLSDSSNCSLQCTSYLSNLVLCVITCCILFCVLFFIFITSGGNTERTLQIAA